MFAVKRAESMGPFTFVQQFGTKRCKLVEVSANYVCYVYKGKDFEISLDITIREELPTDVLLAERDLTGLLGLGESCYATLIEDGEQKFAGEISSKFVKYPPGFTSSLGRKPFQVINGSRNDRPKDRGNG